MLTPTAYVFWLTAFLLNCAVVYRILVTGTFRAYPIFFAYAVEHILSFLSLFLSFHFGTLAVYTHFYMGWEVVDALLKFAMIGELFAHLFAAYKSIRERGTMVVRATTVVLVLCAAVVAFLSNIADPNNLLSRFFAMERSAEIVQGGLLFLLFGSCYLLGLHWKQPSLGIAFGLSITTGIFLVMFTLNIEAGGLSDQVRSLIPSAGFDLCMVAWLITLYPQRRTNDSIPSSRSAWDVASWNRMLLELLRR
jgi:hypothetical protein